MMISNTNFTENSIQGEGNTFLFAVVNITITNTTFSYNNVNEAVFLYLDNCCLENASFLEN